MIREIEFGDSPDIRIVPGSVVFFDMDGTLIDTDRVNYLAYRRALQEVTDGTQDIAFTYERFDGASLAKNFPNLTDVQRERIGDLKATYFSELVTETRVNDALAKLIAASHQENRLVLATGCREKRAAELLEHHGLLRLFSRKIFKEDLLAAGSMNKYEHAFRLTGACMRTSLIFEDEPGSVRMAESFGVPRRNIFKIVPVSGVMS